MLSHGGGAVERVQRVSLLDRPSTTRLKKPRGSPPRAGEDHL